MIRDTSAVKAIIPDAGGRKFQIDFENDQTALISDWQILEKL